MTHADFEFECECTGKTPVKFKMPGTFRVGFQYVNCSECGSQWEIKVRQLPANQFQQSQRLIQGSSKLGEFIRKKRLEALIAKPQPKPFKLYLGGK